MVGNIDCRCWLAMNLLAPAFSDLAWLWVRVLDSADSVGDVVGALEFCRVPVFNGLPIVLKRDWGQLLLPGILANFSKVWVFDRTEPADFAQYFAKVDALTTDAGPIDIASPVAATAEAALKQLGASIVLADGAYGMNFVTTESELVDRVVRCGSAQNSMKR